MKKINSADLLRSMKSSSLNFLSELTTILEKEPAVSLGEKYPNGQWNVLQVLDHLNSYYRYYLPQLERKIETSHIPAEKEFSPGWLGNYFTKMMQPRANGSIKKMKAFKNHVPEWDLNGPAVIEEFLAGQRKLVLLLEMAAKCNLNGHRIPITISPLITLQLGDILRFIVAHNERHRLQIERTLLRFKAPNRVDQGSLNGLVANGQ